MDGVQLASIVGLLVALSVASERLVEIVKGIVPFLREERKNVTQEGWRRALLQVVGVAAGIVTAFLARPAIPDAVLPATGTVSLVALGLLASGGSGFWNAVLTYVLQVKNLSELALEEKKITVDALTTSVRARVTD